MATTTISQVIQHVRKTEFLRDGAGVSDGELLGSFINDRDHTAFAVLLQRHGRMVWAVCRRLLDNHHDVEDAFQATFVVLVRKAASIKPRDMVGNWLHGVAYQTALKARAMSARRKMREKQVIEMPESAASQHDPWNDLQPILDQELNRLPAKYRAAIILCDLEGKTRKEAARQLNLPEGTVSGHLTRGRAMLARRIGRHGIVLSGPGLAVVLAENAGAAGIPAVVMASTKKLTSVIASGQAAAQGVLSAKVAALTEGVMKAMLFTKLRAALAVVLILGFVATGMTIFASRMAAGQDNKKPTAEKPVEPAKPQKEKEESFTAWGKEVDGLQAGLGFRPGQKRAYHHGETVTLVVRVRNVSKEDVKFRYLKEFFMEKPPTVTGGEGKTIRLGGVVLFGRLVHIPVDVNLTPGKDMELHNLKIKLAPAGGSGDVTEVSPETLNGKGKFQIQYEQLAAASIDPILSKLATGKLELEVKEPEKQPQKGEKEAFTEWGKEVGGLQAGLGYPPGQHPTYYTSETARLVVRVRNVGKDAVKFQYYPLFFKQKPPTVTDGGGKPVDFRYGLLDTARFHVPVDVNLAPGKEIVLGEVELPTTLGTGKFTAQYEQVFGKTYQGNRELDPALSKLATGKLELEIKSDPPRVSDKSITIRVVIEKVNAGSRAITASSVALGEIDGERKPLRLENLGVSIFAKVRINGKERPLTDLKARTEARLELDGRESTLTVIGIEVPDDY